MWTPATLCLILLNGPTEQPGHYKSLAVAGERPAAFYSADSPVPLHLDAAAKSTVFLIQGGQDPNCGGLGALCDGVIPYEVDQPQAGFSFAQGSGSGRIVIDLGWNQSIKRVSTYSRHPWPRANQAYTLYICSAEAMPEVPADLDHSGWLRVGRITAKSDWATSTAAHIGGGGASFGRARFLLFDIEGVGEGKREATYWSEIDVISSAGRPGVEIPEPSPGHFAVSTSSARSRVTFALGSAPHLADAVKANLVPVVREWYPRIEALLPSEGFSAPAEFTIQFLPADQMGDMAAFPAYATGTQVVVNATWYAENLEGEAVGCVVHELVHVVQQYIQGEHPTPTWLTEGIADYIRWFLFEPETGGAEIGLGYLPRAKHDQSYRVSANFLNYVITEHGDDVLTRLNHAARWGAYDSDLWVELTGRTLGELEADWLADLREKLER